MLRDQNFTFQALKDKRNLLHESEAKKRREMEFYNFRRKLILQQHHYTDDVLKVEQALKNFNANQLSTREGRTQVKETIKYVTAHVDQFRNIHQILLNTADALIKMPINDTTISLIYHGLQVMISIGVNQEHIIKNIWKLIHASLTYINQQQGYIIVRNCLIVLGNTYLDHKWLYVCSQVNLNESLVDLLSTLDKGIIYETLWMLNNILTAVEKDDNEGYKLVKALTEQIPIDFLKILDRFIQDEPLIKELLWMILSLSKIHPVDLDRQIAVNALQKLQGYQDKQILCALMILTQLTSKGLKDPLLVDLLFDLAQKPLSLYCLRELIVCISNLVIEDAPCQQKFYSHDWKTFLFRALNEFMTDGLFLLNNLMEGSPISISLLRSDQEMCQIIQNILVNNQLPEQMIKNFSQLIY